MTHPFQELQNAKAELKAVVLEEMIDAAKSVISWAIHDIPTWALFRGNGNERIVRLDEAIQAIKGEKP